MNGTATCEIMDIGANGGTCSKVQVHDVHDKGDRFGQETITNGINDIGEYTPTIKANGLIHQDHNEARQPIAIVGMGMRLPGGANSAETFWDLLVNGRDGRCIVPADRYNIEAFHSSTGKPGTSNTKYGYFLQDADLQHLDAAFFSMNKRELERLDPQQRMLLEVVWECMENAGQVGWRDGRSIGCYVGVFGEDWQDLAYKDSQNLGMYRITGYGDFAISNRVSYEYNLKGPSMTLRTACSSSLTGLHEACLAIEHGECDSAIVAGTNLIISPTTTIAMTEQGVLSPTGSCKSFDAKADGYARGEAINAIYIKKLDDAVRDGDPIRAVIRSTAINCDGKTPGMANPSSECHEALMRRAYADARVRDLSRTAIVECHGTGTAIGDPLEVTAVANVFGDEGVYIGSVKPNVGHSEGASGITSLIKTVLALEHETIPPNINFSEPHPQIPFKKAKLQVPLKPTPWPENRDLRASVNSFGIGGANAHVVLESAKCCRSLVHPVPLDSVTKTRPQLLLFSAKNPDSLRNSVQSYQSYALANPSSLMDLAYTLGVRREHLEHRAFCTAKGGTLSAISTFSKPKSAPCVHYVFTGQGAQWAGMGCELMDSFPDCLSDIKQLDSFLAELLDAPDWTIEEELLKPEGSSKLNKAELAQPLCTAVQIVLVNLLQSFGVIPSSVVGHSSGEIAAAYASNAISAKSAIIAAYYRGFVTKTQVRPGGMTAVGLSRDEASQFLTKGVVIACENSQSSVTLSGDREKLDEVSNAIKSRYPETLVRQLKVDMAYHSRHMEEVGGQYQRCLEGHIPSTSPTVPFYSSLTGQLLRGSNKLSEAYWRSNLESPVLFLSAIRAILDDPSRNDLFLEIGPHTALAGPLRQIFKTFPTHKTLHYVSTLTRKQDCTESILTALGNLYSCLVPLNFEAITPSGQVLTDLPAYHWNHDSKYWNETRVTRQWRFRQFPPHELLGSRIMEGNDLEPTWRNILSLEKVPWIEDHKIVDDIVFPAAGYIAMVGEAMRQLRITDDLTLRRVIIKTALVLQPADTIELMTSLRPVQLTTSLNSDWYEFSIASYNSSSWTIHSTGQVKAGPELPSPTKDLGNLNRKISASRWYAAMKRVGLNYGPCFRGLSNITSSPGSNSANASLTDRYRDSETPYKLHPTTIDQCLQLFTVGVAEGLRRRMTSLCVPTRIEYLYINTGEPDMRARVEGRISKKGTIVGDAFTMAGEKVALDLRGGTFSPLDDESTASDSEHVHAAQLHWMPDIDFVAPHDLIRAAASPEQALLKGERLTLLCIMETLARTDLVDIAINHLQKLRSWLGQIARRAKSGGYELLEDASALTELSSDQRLAMIKEIRRELEGGPVGEICDVIVRILDSCEGIFSGSIEPLEILLQDQGLTKIYNFYQDVWDVSKFFHLLGHSKPTLRVLEIGAGTGGTTISALSSLTGSDARLYSQYDFTDISAGFFINAKERFKGFQNIRYAVLDISKEPTAQGFEAESYDLIIASNVLHATPSINLTLQHVRKLLAPNGRLLLQELTPKFRMFNYIMGILPGWWLGDSDGRPNEPFISPDRWDKELRRTGFSGTDIVIYDHDIPYQINATIVSRATTEVTLPNKVTLLYDGQITTSVMQVETAFEQHGFHVLLSTIEDLPPSDHDVVSLTDLNSPMFDNINESRLNALQRYIGKLKSNGLIWVTRSAQLGCVDPRYSQVLGVARAARSELLTKIATLELDVINTSSIKAIVQVFRKVQRQLRNQQSEQDLEYAMFDGAMQIPRYHWLSIPNQLKTISHEQAPMKLEVGKYGLLQSLRWIHDSPVLLQGDDVEIEPRAIGLNFKDILVSLGIVEGTKDGLGLEGAGVIRSIGPDVSDLSIGDRVLFFQHGCLSTSLVTSAKVVAKIPDDLSYEDAATMPCVYSTVIYSLLTIGRLERGQTVLIHSACGGVGLAAIQICKAVGAQIYTTVGSDEKVQHLIENEGIPRKHIFYSHNNSFYSDLMNATNGRGVDVVLNSLSGELLHVSWQCVADFGKMLEIGKRDFIGSGRLSMDAFENNRAFFGIDLAQIVAEKPAVCLSLLQQCMDLYKAGTIRPIKPMRSFSATEVIDAFRYMQGGQHIGKIVVTMPENLEDLKATPMRRDLQLRADRSYLLVGGLGGLGQAISTWLVENGARHLVYISRSAGKSTEHEDFFKELAEQGCSVQVFAGSAIDIEHVKHAIKNASQPVAGVMHMSMVLKDQNLLQFTHDEWQTAVEPKVKVTWNLHEALASEPIDFFLLFSSISGIVGYWGQANYASANAFLDSFVQYRHSLNLPASVIDIGAIADVGYVSENTAVLDQMKATSTHLVTEQELVDALQLAITQKPGPPPSAAGYTNPAQIAIGLGSTKSISDPTNRTIWAGDIRMSLYKNLESTTSTATEAGNDELKLLLSEVASEPSVLNDQAKVDFLTHQIGCRLYNFMLKPEEDVDLKLSLVDLGVDSLMAIEIRNWCRQVLGLEISVLEIMNSGSIEGLGHLAADKLQKKFGSDNAEQGDTYLLMKAP